MRGDDNTWRAGVSAAAAAAAAATAAATTSSTAAGAPLSFGHGGSGGLRSSSGQLVSAAAAAGLASRQNSKGVLLGRSDGSASIGAGRIGRGSSSSGGGSGSSSGGSSGAGKAAPLHRSTAVRASSGALLARPPVVAASRPTGGPFAAAAVQQRPASRRTTSSSGGGSSGGGSSNSGNPTPGGGGLLSAAAANAVTAFERPLTSSLARLSTGRGRPPAAASPYASSAALQQQQRQASGLQLPPSLQPSRQPSFLISTTTVAGLRSTGGKPEASRAAVATQQQQQQQEEEEAQLGGDRSISSSSSSSNSSSGSGNDSSSGISHRAAASTSSDVSELSESLRVSPFLAAAAEAPSSYSSPLRPPALPPSTTTAWPSQPLASSAASPLPPGIVGLLNLGNSCFASSVLQALYCVPAFTDSLKRAARGGGSGSRHPSWMADAAVAPKLAALFRRMRRAGRCRAERKLQPSLEGEEDAGHSTNSSSSGRSDDSAFGTWPSPATAAAAASAGRGPRGQRLSSPPSSCPRSPSPPPPPRLPLAPRALLAALARDDDRWAGGGGQEDAHEFLRALLDRLRDECRGGGKAGAGDRGQQEEEEEQRAENNNEEDAQARAALEAWQRQGPRQAPCVDGVFGGLMRSTLTCLGCGHRSHRFEPFFDLLLPLPWPCSGGGGGSADDDPLLSSSSAPRRRAPAAGARAHHHHHASISLDRLLRDFMAPERLDGDERVRCERCGGEPRPAEKRQRVWAWPRALVVALKRFQPVVVGASVAAGPEATAAGPCFAPRYGRAGAASPPPAPAFSAGEVRLLKNGVPVTLAPGGRLDLRPYCAQGEAAEADGAAAAAGSLPPPIYRLVASVRHSGSMHGGHYTCAGDGGDGGDWFTRDDDLVWRSAGGVSEAMRDAYVLVFAQQEEEGEEAEA
jgi:ubiquitin C-terminal hydrolase